MRKYLLSEKVGLQIPAHVFLVVTLTFFILCSTLSYGQSVLVKDINQREEDTYNEYSNLTAGDGKAYFVSRGNELWTSYLQQDDTDVSVKLGTYQLISNLTVVGSTLYFCAEEGNGYELYKTDGTVQGTIRVKDIYPGSPGSNPSLLTNVNGVLYFVANNGISGKELWKSNGTSAGTLMVKDIFSKSGSSNPAHLTNVNGTLFFAANDGANGYEVWKSDGSSAGTVLVKDIRTGSKLSSAPDKFANVNGVLYFTANETTTGRELYRSDGSATGTVLVKDIRPGTASSSIDNLAAVNSMLYFTANDGVYGDELWKSDGTLAGTVLVKDLTPGSAGSHGEQPGTHRMGNFTNVNGLLFFTAYEKNNHYIWKSDGTVTGTVPVEKVYGPGTLAPRPDFTVMNGALFYFNSYEWDDTSISLKRRNLDGTNERYIYDIYTPYQQPAYYSELALVLDHNQVYHVYFYGVPAFAGFKLLKSSGSEDWEETIWLPDAYTPTAGSSPHDFRVLNGKTYFTAQESWYGNESVMVTDGTSGGTYEALYFTDKVGEIAASQNYVYGSGKDWLEIQRTAGSIYDYNIIIEDYYAPPALELTPVNGNIFFRNQNGELWKVDEATEAVTKLEAAAHKVLPNLVALGSNLIFQAEGEQSQIELWRSNGTENGTIRYFKISPEYEYPSKYKPSVTIRNTHFFIANNGVNGNELWRTQGSGASTYMVADLNTNDAAYYENAMEADIRNMVVFRDSLYISAIDNSGTWSLLKTNGTAAGLRKVMAMNQVIEMIPAGNYLYLFELDPITQSKIFLYVTNGTEAGTKFLTEIYPSDRIHHQVVNNVLYFHPTGINEVWRSDGTECGTFKIEFGVDGDYNFGKVGNALLFSGLHADFGYELYAFNTAGVTVPPCEEQLMASGFSTEEFTIADESLASAYPNPFQHELMLRVNGREEQMAEVKVYTTSGVQVDDLNAIQCNKDYAVGVNWPLGMYVLKINSGGRIFSEKVIKQK